MTKRLVTAVLCIFLVGAVALAAEEGQPARRTVESAYPGLCIGVLSSATIGELPDDKSFHVIFYSSGPPVEMPTRRLVEATEHNKQLAFEFVDGVIAQGETDPSKAIERAFACQPELIYLLTDGEFDRQIVDLVKRLNAGGKVTVHTIGFLYQSGAEVLKQIANDNGGNFKLVTEQDLANLAK
jgi:hypothetical protein